ncbi:MAG TPA: PilN domain-containing protein [Phycisphaerales bacterium]|nr:PilN domain-containing protein [Phycisphaerales bacterium]
MSKLIPWQPAENASGFLPKDYVQGRQETRFVAITVSLFLVVMLGVVTAFLVTNRRWASVRSQQQAIAAEYEAETAKLEQLKQLESQREEMLSKARITTALLENAPRSVLLAELVTTLPENATLLSVELESKRVKPAPAVGAAQDAAKAKSRAGAKSKETAKEEPPKPVVLPPKFEFSLSIMGVAPTNNEVADYLTRLQESPLLERVELISIEQTKLEDLDLRRFHIEAQLPQNADAREVDEAEEFELDLAEVTDAEEEGQ